jgi:hypothetical protein
MSDANRSERSDREVRSDDSECNITRNNSENSLDSECNLTKSGSENSLDSECRVDRIDRTDKSECEEGYEDDRKDKKKYTEDDICELNLKTRSIGLYNRKPINIVMKGRHYYLKYDGYLYNIPEWAKEINIKQDLPSITQSVLLNGL